MKLSKKYLAISVLIVTPLFAVRSKEEIITAFTSTHTGIFGNVPNAITKRITRDKKDTWNLVLSEIGNYVNTNASQYNPTFEALSNISDQLFNTLAYNYATNVSGKEKPDGPASSKYVYTYLYAPLNQVKTFTNVKPGEIKVPEIKARFALPKTKSAQEKIDNVRALLFRLALALELTIEKVIRDAEKLKK